MCIRSHPEIRDLARGLSCPRKVVDGMIIEWALTVHVVRSFGVLATKDFAVEMHQIAEEPSSSPIGFRLPGKKGVAFTLRDDGQKGSWLENLPKVLALRPHWNYSWGIGRLDEKLLPTSIEFIPMFWSCKSTQTIDANLSRIRAQKSKIVLGFNEPDKKQQANMSVAQALEAWPMLESLNLPLVSPSCANAESEWMESFMNAIDRNGLRVDIIGVHHYGGASAQAFRTKLERIFGKYGRPIIITEFAVADWSAKTPEENKFAPAKVLLFMKEILPWLETTPWILGYAWFPFGEASPCGTSSALFHSDGSMTALGDYYASFEHNSQLE